MKPAKADDKGALELSAYELEELLANGSLLLRPSELPRLLNVSRSSIYELLRAGLLPSIKINRSVRVPLKALLEWIDANTRPPEC